MTAWSIAVRGLVGCSTSITAKRRDACRPSKWILRPSPGIRLQTNPRRSVRQFGALHGYASSLLQTRQQCGAEARSGHGVGLAILDARQLGHQVFVPTRVISPHHLLE